MQNATLQRLYTIQDVAAILAISEEHTRRLTREGKLRGRKFGRVWRFTEEDLEAFIEEAKVHA